MYQALIAACCALAGLQPPLAQNWSDTTLIRADDDWSAVPRDRGVPRRRPRGRAGHRPEPGGRGRVRDTRWTWPRTGRIPSAFGLAAGVAEFELANPVVALRGSVTAGAPQLVFALDTRGRAGIAVRLTLRDIDTGADAVQPVALQYRVGGTGNFGNVPGGFVADATMADNGPRARRPRSPPYP